MVKKNIKYMSLFLAIMICFGLIIIITTETQTKKTINIITNNMLTNTSEEKQTENINNDGSNIPSGEFNIKSFYNILLKCGFAFMLGGLISERKFINLGKI